MAQARIEWPALAQGRFAAGARVKYQDLTQLN